MTEPEVSIRLALYYIKNRMTGEMVTVSIDGAHIKTGSTVHFPIQDFLTSVGCRKVVSDDRWQGIYEVEGYKEKIEIVSNSGIGDVRVHLKNGKILYVESKKGKANKSSQEYSLMREAIGQLMTGIALSGDIIPMVAVPYSSKSYELANRWCSLEQIKIIGIQFALIHDDGKVDFVK